MKPLATILLTLLASFAAAATPGITPIAMREASAATYYIQAEIPGVEPFELMVDTGSGLMTINEQTLAHLQRLDSVRYVKQLEGILADGRRMVVPVYRIAQINIGGDCALYDIDAAVFPGQTRQILGLSALRKAAPFTFSIDPPQLMLSGCEAPAPALPRASIQARPDIVASE